MLSPSGPVSSPRTKPCRPCGGSGRVLRQPVIEWLDGLVEPREMLCAACNGCGAVAVNCTLCGDTMRDDDGGPCWCAPGPVLGGLLILAPLWLGWAAMVWA